jgi:hypothetical protein
MLLKKKYNAEYVIDVNIYRISVTRLIKKIRH